MDNKINWKKILLIAITVMVLLSILAYFSYLYFFKTSEKATLEINPIPVTSKVEGQIISLNVDINSKVEKGEILAQINSLEYQNKVESLQKQYDKLIKEIEKDSSDAEKIEAKNTRIKKDIVLLKTQLEEANNDYVRYKNAYRDGAVTKKDLKNATKNLQIAHTNYEEAQNYIQFTDGILNEVTSKKNDKNDKLKKIENELEQAKLNLSYTDIIAPQDGTIVAENVEINDIVDVKKQLITIIPNDFYISCEFKQKDIDNIKDGQKALILIRGLNKKPLIGRVSVLEENGNKKVKVAFRINILKYDISSGQKAKVFVKVK